MEKTLVFIDAGFLSKLSKHFGEGEYLIFDIIKFAVNISSKEKLQCEQIFYYTAPPFQSNKPSREESKRKENYDQFITKLSKNKKITIKEGRCQRIDDKFKQKGVDTLMTMDLMSVPILYKDVKRIILIACDSDFVPVVEYLKKLGLKTILYTYYEEKNRKSKFSTSNQLIKTAHKYVIISKKDFDDSPLNKEFLNTKE